MAHSIERRASKRFQISLPVLFRWADGDEHYDTGHCGNLGLGGIFILTSRCPPSGVEVEVEFALPAFDLVPHPVTLRYVGRVSRVEACYRLSGFAITGQILNDLDALTAGELSLS